MITSQDLRAPILFDQCKPLPEQRDRGFSCTEPDAQDTLASPVNKGANSAQCERQPLPHDAPEFAPVNKLLVEVPEDSVSAAVREERLLTREQTPCCAGQSTLHGECAEGVLY